MRIYSDRGGYGIEPVPPVSLINPVDGEGHSSSGREQGRRHSGEKQRLTPAECFRPLSRAVDLANRKLEAAGHPHRLSLSRESGRVILECALVREGGARELLYRKDITTDDFVRWVEDITSVEGVLYDSSR